VQVLHHLNAGRARCAVITLDTPGANYRAVWAMNKHYPNAKIYVRAHDVSHGINLEKAGATAGTALLFADCLLACACIAGIDSAAEATLPF
jgi:voltage-gated potassium channel Kch